MEGTDLWEVVVHEAGLCICDFQAWCVACDVCVSETVIGEFGFEGFGSGLRSEIEVVSLEFSGFHGEVDIGGIRFVIPAFQFGVLYGDMGFLR